MWVHFNLLCGREVQRRLHNIFRHKIKDWEKRKLVKGAVLTYHFHTPRDPKDSLYVCLDIPAVKEPRKRSTKLPDEAIKQIPSEITRTMKQICNQNQIELEIIDYELETREEKAKKESQGIQYYRGAPVEDVLRFASVGTKIALQILDLVETGERPLSSGRELASFIISELKKELGESYFWLLEALHFVCNPLRLSKSSESYIWTLERAQKKKDMATNVPRSS